MNPRFSGTLDVVQNITILQLPIENDFPSHVYFNSKLILKTQIKHIKGVQNDKEQRSITYIKQRK